MTLAVAPAVPPAVCAWQWKDATRKNYYAKYSARMTLSIHLFINIAVLPSVLHTSHVKRESSESDVQFYNRQVTSAMVSNAA